MVTGSLDASITEQKIDDYQGLSVIRRVASGTLLYNN